MSVEDLFRFGWLHSYVSTPASALSSDPSAAGPIQPGALERDISASDPNDAGRNQAHQPARFHQRPSPPRPNSTRSNCKLGHSAAAEGQVRSSSFWSARISVLMAMSFSVPISFDRACRIRHTVRIAFAVRPVFIVLASSHSSILFYSSDNNAVFQEEKQSQPRPWGREAEAPRQSENISG